MEHRTLVERVEILEKTVEGLSSVPERVSSLEVHLLQFREEVRDEFSAVRTELGGVEGRLRGEMHDLEGRLRSEMNTLNEQTLTLMRVLHEEVIGRIALIGEKRP